MEPQEFASLGLVARVRPTPRIASAYLEHIGIEPLPRLDAAVAEWIGEAAGVELRPLERAVTGRMLR